MRLGICSCCTVPSGSGFFDMYGVDSNIFYSAGTNYINEFLWYRNPSVVLPSSFALHNVAISANSNFFWDIDMRSSGFMNYGEVTHCNAPRDYIDDKVWSFRANINRPQLFNSYDNISGSGWNIGSGARVEGHNLINKSNNINSGLYVLQTGRIYPTVFLDALYNLYVEIPTTYSKAVLCTFPDFYAGDGYRVWFKTTGNTKYDMISGIIPTYAPVVTRYKRETSYLVKISDLHVDALVAASGSAIKVQLVDDTGLFYYSGASGEAFTIPTISFSESLDSEYSIDTNVDAGGHIALVDINYRVPRTIHRLTHTQYLGSVVSGSDMGKYVNMSGSGVQRLWPESTVFAYMNGFALDTQFTSINNNINYNENYYLIENISQGYSQDSPWNIQQGTRTFYDYDHPMLGDGVSIKESYRISGFYSAEPMCNNSYIHGSAISRDGSKIAYFNFGMLEDSTYDGNGNLLYFNNDTQYRVNNEYELASNSGDLGMYNYDWILEIDSIKVQSGTNPFNVNLIGHWPLQDYETNNTVRALVGPTGVYVSDANRRTIDASVSGPGGIYPKALHFFQPSGEAVRLSSSLPGTKLLSDTSGLSMMLWACPSTDPGQIISVGQNGVASDERAYLGWTSGTLEVGYENSVNALEFVEFKNVFSPREWHHLAVEMDLSGKRARGYVDGVLVGNSGFNWFDNKTDIGDPQRIRFFEGVGGASVEGSGAGIRIYSGLVGSGFINRLYNYELGLSGLDTGVVTGYSTTGELNFTYGEQYNWGQVETDQYLTGTLSGNAFHAGPITNLTINLPRIEIVANKDYPNCWSVINPIQQLTGQSGNMLTVTGAPKGTYPVSLQINTVVDNTKILYGRIVSGDYPVYLKGNINNDDTQTGSAFYNITGRYNGKIFRLNRHLLYGSSGGSGGQVFWEDSRTGNVLFFAYINTSGTGIPVYYPHNGATTVTSISSGLMCNTVPLCSSRVLWGDNKGDTLGAIFTHTQTTTIIFDSGGFPYYFNPEGGYRNSSTQAFLSGSPSFLPLWESQTGYVLYSGDSYVKVKIGDNIVFDKQIYHSNQVKRFDERNYGELVFGEIYPGDILPVVTTAKEQGMSFEVARGLSAIESTESAQTLRISGTGAISSIGFGWFERLWKTFPSGAIHSGTGIPTGWRLHITNTGGIDLWTLDTHRAKWLTTSGEETGQIFTITDGPISGTGSMANRGLPQILGSSDRFIYINGFFLCDKKLSQVDEWKTDNGGIDYTAVLIGQDQSVSEQSLLREPVSGGGWSWAISHDGRERFPIRFLERHFTGAETVFGGRTAGNLFDRPHSLPALREDNLDFIPLGPGINYLNYKNTADFVKHTNVVPYCPSKTEYGATSCHSSGAIYWATSGVWVATGT